MLARVLEDWCVNTTNLRLKKFLVERRNGNVIQQLEQQYSKSVKDNDLRVWCVSNVDYERFREESSALGDNHRSLSGIIGLRSYCQLIPAEAQFKAVAAFLEHQIPTLLGSLRQWIRQGSDTLAAQNTEALSRVLTECADSFQQVSICSL
jgi:predicted metal-dependent hydrolase